jgi:hypothetical protein
MLLQNDSLRLPPFHLDADPYPDPDPIFHFDADPDPSFYFDADPNSYPYPDFHFDEEDADPDPQHCN